MKRCQNSAFVYFQWFPWRCYVSFRLHIAFWFCRGCMLAGGPVVWMPEHVSGESVPSMKLSWAWTENHHSDAAVESIKCSSRPGLSQKNPCHVVMGITAPRLGVCLGFYFFIFFRGHILLCKYFDIRSLMYFSFISEQLRNFWPCHMIKLWELYSRFGWLWTFLCAAFRHSHARLKRLMFPITVTNVIILSLRVVVETEVVGRKRTLEAGWVGRWSFGKACC